jgi:hypothetical protein
MSRVHICCWSPTLRSAGAGRDSALQHVHDAADDATIIHPLNAPDIRRQERFDPLHCSSLSQNRFSRIQKRIRIVLSERKN